VEAPDLSVLAQAYAGRGSPPYHPAMMLSLLIDGHATWFGAQKATLQVNSDRPLERPSATTRP